MCLSNLYRVALEKNKITVGVPNHLKVPVPTQYFTKYMLVCVLCSASIHFYKTSTYNKFNIEAIVFKCRYLQHHLFATFVTILKAV